MNSSYLLSSQLILSRSYITVCMESKWASSFQRCPTYHYKNLNSFPGLLTESVSKDCLNSDSKWTPLCGEYIKLNINVARWSMWTKIGWSIYTEMDLGPN